MVGELRTLVCHLNPQSLVHYSGPMFQPLPDHPDQTFGGAKEVQVSDHQKIASAWGKCNDLFKDAYVKAPIESEWHKVVIRPMGEYEQIVKQLINN